MRVDLQVRLKWLNPESCEYWKSLGDDIKLKAVVLFMNLRSTTRRIFCLILDTLLEEEKQRNSRG